MFEKSSVLLNLKLSLGAVSENISLQESEGLYHFLYH